MRCTVGKFMALSKVGSNYYYILMEVDIESGWIKLNLSLKILELCVFLRSLANFISLTDDLNVYNPEIWLLKKVPYLLNDVISKVL
jgi:hypothetical protein